MDGGCLPCERARCGAMRAALAGAAGRSIASRLSSTPSGSDRMWSGCDGRHKSGAASGWGRPLKEESSLSGSTSGSAGRMRAFRVSARTAVGVDRRVRKWAGSGNRAGSGKSRLAAWCGSECFGEIRVSTQALDELADFAKGGGRKENHRAPLIRLLFAKDTKLIPVSVVTSPCEFPFSYCTVSDSK